MSAPLAPKERLIVALDVATGAEALVLVDLLAGAVGQFKVGSQLFTEAGPAFVRGLVARGERVFLDLKYHDIPNTVAGAVARAAGLGVSLLSVHALGGPAMLAAARGALPGGEMRLLAITILTSHSDRSLGEVGVAGPVAAAVGRLAAMARAVGIDGVVASPQEVGLVREACGSAFLVVTPGIRPLGAESGDQARVATPEAAISAGADYIVVGRPILEARDPRAAAESIVARLPR